MAEDRRSLWLALLGLGALSYCSMTQPAVTTAKRLSACRGVIELVAQAVLYGYRAEYGMMPEGDEGAIGRALMGENAGGRVFMEWPRRLVGTNGEVLDPFGHPLVIRFPGPESVEVGCSGPNGVFGDGDDEWVRWAIVSTPTPVLPGMTPDTRRPTTTSIPLEE
jgi:hypothetical protein